MSPSRYAYEIGTTYGVSPSIRPKRSTSWLASRSSISSRLSSTGIGAPHIRWSSEGPADEVGGARTFDPSRPASGTLELAHEDEAAEHGMDARPRSPAAEHRSVRRDRGMESRMEGRLALARRPEPEQTLV